MDIEYTLIKFKNIDLKPRDATKLRGFFSNKYIDQEIVHNHNGDKYIYNYPKVQYKSIKKQPIVCGIGEGANIALKMSFETDKLIIGNRELSAMQKSMVKEQRELGIISDYKEYKFFTPWLALNQKNIAQYNTANSIERESMLKRILIGNILSMSKGLGYTVTSEIYAWINLEERIIKFKGMEMKSFIGTFKTNFLIPDYLGLGKSVSRGFGTIISKER